MNFTIIRQVQKMIATQKTVYDGQTYEVGQEIWDLGSFECTSVEGNMRSYQGLSADVAKLPKYDNLGTGSTAQCLDTGDFYSYHAPTKTWYEQ